MYDYKQLRYIDSGIEVLSEAVQEMDLHWAVWQTWIHSDCIEQLDSCQTLSLQLPVHQKLTHS